MSEKVQFIGYFRNHCQSLCISEGANFLMKYMWETMSSTVDFILWFTLWWLDIFVCQIFETSFWIIIYPLLKLLNNSLWNCHLYLLTYSITRKMCIGIKIPLKKTSSDLFIGKLRIAHVCSLWDMHTNLRYMY